jgi:4-hydroxybenzoyl-CoA reductase subunit beta
MLRMPKFEVRNPSSLNEALELLAAGGERAVVVAGGTDLLPNIKHELFTPDTVISLQAIPELRGVRVEEDGDLVIGALTPLQSVAESAEVRERAPALAQATSLIAGPQLRRMGTLGGNVLLDTRCQWYNQTYFWREALGFCLKKDGTVCHVVEKGSRCVAAASNDSAPVLMTLGATLEIHSSRGVREVLIDDLWRNDGAYNKDLAGDEILSSIRIPAQAPGHRGAYGKLRDRGSIDFPLLGIAVRLDLGDDGAVADADVVSVALQAQPVRVKQAAELLAGKRPGTESFDEALEALAQAAYKRCRPMPNIPGDHDYRREMVPVYVRRTVRAAVEGNGPVHHV